MRDLLGLAEALMPIATPAAGGHHARLRGAFSVQHKDDDSPLTLADLESQRIIVAGLQRSRRGIPMLSEESAQAPWSERRRWRELWVVDPLDGTREFVKRNGEFTINIALVVEHEPVLGLVAAPAQERVYCGAAGCGAYRRLPPGAGLEDPDRAAGGAAARGRQPLARQRRDGGLSRAPAAARVTRGRQLAEILSVWRKAAPISIRASAPPPNGTPQRARRFSRRLAAMSRAPTATACATTAARASSTATSWPFPRSPCCRGPEVRT